MNERYSRGGGWSFVAAVMLAATLAGCKSAPEQPPSPQPPSSESISVLPPPPPPRPPTPEAKAQAQKLALEAVDRLQNGDEVTARSSLDKAQALDPGNELAKNLMRQITADAQRELGPTSWRYVVQRNDTLGKIAGTYMGDNFRFYILAKYNNITVPNRLAVGQEIKIPGTKPPSVSKLGKPPVPPDPTAAAPVPPPPPPPPPLPARREAERLYQQGLVQKNSGNLTAAYDSFSEAARRDPDYQDAVDQREATKKELIGKYQREAKAARARHEPTIEIQKWDQVLELDPSNETAKTERQGAINLKSEFDKKFK